MRRALLISVVLTCFAAWSFYWADIRNHEEMRDAVMIDTRSDSSTSKGHTSYNTVGIFRDKLTGKVFGSSINDSLYRSFERGNNAPIDCRWAYSIDKVEQTSIGVFAFLWAVVLSLFAVALPVMAYFDQRSRK